MQTMDELLTDAVEKKASDIHLKTDNPPIYRLDGTLTRMDMPILNNDTEETLLSEIVTTKDMAKFTKLMELDSSYTLEGKARFRINACRDDGDARVVLRIIPVDILSLEALKLPEVLKPLTEHKNGLVTGPTGSGKSMITQRAVGQDTLSFVNALRGALRQDPDIILIGEMRDAETVGTGMSSAEIGHLVFSTLHTVSAVETIHRILDFFEPHQQVQVRKQLSTVIRGILSQ